MEGSEINLHNSMAAASGGSSKLDADLEELVDVGQLSAETPESVLDQSGGNDPTASSTVIGKKELVGSDEDEEVDLDSSDFEEKSADQTGSGLSIDDDDFDISLLDEPDAGASSVLDGSPAMGSGFGSELNLSDSSAEVATGGSELFLADDASAVNDDLLAGETGNLGNAAATDASDEELILDEEADLHLSDEELEISLGSSASELQLDGGSELKLAVTDTSINLDQTDEPDAGSSDISLDPSMSGIGLESPSDSGISLEQTPPEIAVGGDSLELGEAEMLDLDDGFGDLGSATDLQTDEDFLLTPVEGDMADESDSGSQVIALDSEEFEGSASTLLGEEAVTAESPQFLSDDHPEDAGILAGAPAMQMVPESNYTIWNVVGLGLILLPLALSGLMMFDVIRHMWSWDEPYTINSSLIDALTGVFGK